MKKWVKGLSIVVMSVFFCISFCTFAAANHKIGVLAKRGAPKCMKQWGATAAYLTEKLGTKFTIIPLKFVAIEPAIKSGKIDFLLANSAFFVEMEIRGRHNPCLVYIYTLCADVNETRSQGRDTEKSYCKEFQSVLPGCHLIAVSDA